MKEFDEKANRLFEEYRTKKLIYLSDQKFYILYQIYRLITYYKEHQKHTDCSFEYLKPAHGARSIIFTENSFILKTVCDFQKIMDIGFKGLKLNAENREGEYYIQIKNKLEEYIAKYPNTEQNKKLKEMLSGNMNAKVLTGIGVLLPKEFNKFLEYTILEFKPTEDQVINFVAFMASYMEKFANDELLSSSEGEIFYNFKTQMKTYLRYVKEHVEKHSPNTVITLSEIYEDEDPDKKITKSRGYSKMLPVHSLAFMDFSEYLEVKHIRAGSIDFMESLDFYNHETGEPFEINGYRAEVKIDENSFSEGDEKNKNESEIIILNDNTGLFSEKEPEKIYKVQKIRNGGITSSYKLLKKLIDGKKVGMKELKIIFNTEDKNNIVKGIKSINEKFKKHLGKEDDLIVHIGTGGYGINKKFKLDHQSE